MTYSVDGDSSRAGMTGVCGLVRRWKRMDRSQGAEEMRMMTETKQVKLREEEAGQRLRAARTSLQGGAASAVDWYSRNQSGTSFAGR